MDDWLKPWGMLRLTAVALSMLAGVPTATAAPSRFDDTYYQLLNGTFPGSEFPGTSPAPGVELKARQNSVPLRIMPLGASIMSGVGSSNGNGLRKPLRDALRRDGYEVNYVGSFTNGPMVDHDHEAHSGDVVTQIHDRLKRRLNYKPNIVIINGGTNDANVPVDPGNAGSRMNDLLSTIWGGADMSGTCVMLSTLLPTDNGNGKANSPGINAQYRNLVTTRAKEGKCIYLAEMHPNGQDVVWFDLNLHYDDVPRVHPNDKGHEMMAAVFYNAIKLALKDNKVPKPAEMVMGDGVCDKFEGTGIDAGGWTQRGSGYDDGIYQHKASEKGVILELESDWDRGQWKFARLFNPRFDDLVGWFNDTATTQKYGVWSNSAEGSGRFTKIADMSTDLDCRYPEGVNFIDMNGDGLDDLVYIDADGNAYLSINQGDGIRGAGRPPTFKRVSATAKIMDGTVKRDFVVLGDIDGDGRGDYGRMDWDGNVKWWRNGGNKDAPEYWQALGQRWDGKHYEPSASEGEMYGTRFTDINGDGRDDMVWLDKAGAGHVWTNARSCWKNVEGDGLKVAWREGFREGTTEKAYLGMGTFQNKAEPNLRGRIHFARIYGEENIFGNRPRADYVFFEHVKDGSKHKFKVRVWANAGGGATKLFADGNRYCNMMGHSNGMADYAWFWSVGKLELWANRGKGSIKDSDPDGYWDYKGVIWNPPRNINRKDLHLSDWNNDGACDIIYADPMTGGVTVWINNYPKTKTWSWSEESHPELKCDQKRGVGIFDLAVRFADLTGNGRADYMCLSPDTTIRGQIHKDDGSFGPNVQIKIPINKDRANLRFADVNGDGREDLLWIEKFSGDTFVWYNEGEKKPEEAAGSNFGWRVQDKKAYAGLAAGTCMYYADLNGDGFADEHYLDGTFTNKAHTSLHPGCGLTDSTGDDASQSGPLPSVPNVPGGGGGGGGGGHGDNETGQGCVKGTGPGDYKDLCEYACARGFCPAPPCTCTQQGTYNTGPAEENLDGFSAPGLDVATYAPLCDFTCTYGFCPDECTIGVEAEEDLQLNPIVPITLDDPYDDTVYPSGEMFSYQFPNSPDLSITVKYLGDRVDKLPTNFKCGSKTEGPDGDYLGCVGETIEWLVQSVIENDVVTNSISKRSRPGHTFNLLPRWQEAHEECDGDEVHALHCRLAKRAPVGEEWTAVGEGTWNGAPHSMHVKHTGKTLVIRASAASLETYDDHVKRAIPAVFIGGALLISAVGQAAFVAQYKGKNHPDNKPLDFVPSLAKAGLETTADHYVESCFFVQSNESHLVDVGYPVEGAVLIIGNGTHIGALTQEKADRTITKCNEEEPNRQEYVVWPADGNDVDVLRNTLERFDPATREFKSLNEHGTLYFRSFLSLEQKVRVTTLKQCQECELKCQSCKNPFQRYHSKPNARDEGMIPPDILDALNATVGEHLNTTAHLDKRDGQWIIQDPAPADMAFISSPPGVTRSPYVFDATPGRRVRIYVLDSHFDLSIKEFNVHKDSTGKTIAQKAGAVMYFGRPSVENQHDDDGHDHGTCMLACAAGDNYGVSRESEPIAVKVDWMDGQQWFINALDAIEREWRVVKQYGFVTDIAVLSMSWAYSPSQTGATWEIKLAEQLNRLQGLGVLSLAAAGNTGLPVNKVPCMLSKPGRENFVKDLMCVGAVDNNGQRWVKSDIADYLAAYATGVDITCPLKGYPDDSNDQVYQASGTSSATARVAGLASYFLALPETAKNIRSVQALREYIQRDAYSRNGGPKAVWNQAPLIL